MSVDTEDVIEKDEDLKATESRIIELRQKKDRTPEEEQEFKELRQHHRGRVEEQILSAREEASKAREERAAAQQELADARARLKEIDDNKNVSRETNGSDNETVTINGKKFYTDEAISFRVQKGLMTQKEGWEMQKRAMVEQAKEEMKGEEPQKQADKIRKDSLDYVKSKGYGWMLDAKDPKHNPNDPLFKIADKLWKNGYQYDPDGPRKALEDALEYSGKNVQREDRSDDFGVPKNNSAATSSSVREKKVDLTDIEQANAIRFWCKGNVINSKTGKVYTEAEALAKALDSKRKRVIK